MRGFSAWLEGDLFCRFRYGRMLGDYVLHIAGLESDITSPSPEAPSRIDSFYPFVQRIALGPVLRAVRPLNLKGQKRTAR